MQALAFRRSPPGLALLAVGLTSLFLSTAAFGADATKPARKDTPAKLQPPEAKFTTKITPATAKPGDTVTYTITTKLAPEWHIYTFAEKPQKNGPANTQFDFFDPAGLEVEGTWKADRDAEKKVEPAFPDLPFVEFYEEEVSWSIDLVVPTTATPGKKSLKSQIQFQICDPKRCKPPSRVTVPPATLNVTATSAATLDPSGDRAAALALLTIGVETAPATAAPAAKPASTGVQAEIDRGVIPFVLFAALNGLLALLMPCVWPMLPITVNFFVKQGQARKGSTTGLAITYALSIIGIFTLVGLIFSVAFGASSTTQLGNNPWINLLFGIVFIAFGLSLLGLFEIRLPSALINASSQAEGRGGLIGVIFMALTLTITSFTCTAPLVGGLLVMAAKGSYFYPVLGLVVFSAFLALPFFVLALFPSLMQTMPRSGDWMNSVKVVGGLLEIGAAFKFLNTAEVSFAAGDFSKVWIDTEVLLSVWVVLAFVCGIYLLGLFRTNHDHEAVAVGPGRMLTGTLFLAIALYLAPALFGQPPRSNIYNLIAGILPPDASDLDLRELIVRESRSTDTTSSIADAGNSARPPRSAPDDAREQKATSSDPKEAILQERTVHGVSWGLSYDAAIAQAKESKRPVLIDFTGVNCANCRTMERKIMPLAEVVEAMRNFVTVQLYTDFVPINSLTEEQREDLALENLEREQEMTEQTTSPLYVVVDGEGKVLNSTAFDPDPSKFVQFLKDSLAKFETTNRVAVGSN